MHLFIKRTAFCACLAAVCCGAGAGTFAGLNALAEERENPGMAVFHNGLFRKMPGGNALFVKETFSQETRRAVLMLSREPQNEADFESANEKMSMLSRKLPQGDFLFVIDDSGRILLSREIPKTRKIFDLADEIKVFFGRLESVPVIYFPTDKSRGRIRLDIFEGNTEFPVPAGKGGAQ